MSRLAIAAAQSASISGDIENNLLHHEKFVLAAVEHGVDFLIFPELSLTGYEPRLAAELAISINDKKLQPLQKLAGTHKIVVMVGAPISSSQGKPYLGMLVFGLAKPVLYAKQCLHPGEEEYFLAGKHSRIVNVKATQIGLAICADISDPSLAERAAQAGAQIYAVGVLIAEPGYRADVLMLEGYAKKHRMAVVMANHAAASGGWIPAGRSAIWEESGRLVAGAEGREEALIIAEKTAGNWQGHLVRV
jgi:predicted amidohydrolase